MANFIEVTRVNGEKWLLNTDRIIGITDVGDNLPFITFYQDRRKEGGFSVKESFDELRQKLLGE